MSNVMIDCTYVKLVTELLKFLFIFAHHSNYSTSCKNPLHQSFSKTRTTSSHNHMLIRKGCWRHKSLDVLADIDYKGH